MGNLNCKMNTRIVKIFERLAKSKNKYSHKLSHILVDSKREPNTNNAHSYPLTGVFKTLVAGKKNEKIKIIKPKKYNFLKVFILFFSANGQADRQQWGAAELPSGAAPC